MFGFFGGRGDGSILKQEDISRDGKKYFVSTANTFDHGWETMVFARNENGEVDWADLYSDRYNTQEEAEIGHKSIISNFTTLRLSSSFDT